MKEVDYIVVGLGIAGIAFSEQLKLHGQSFVVFDAAEDSATAIAGGVVNPVVLKRFTPVWNVAQFLPEAFPFYQHISERLATPFLETLPIHRIFNSVLEQNEWLTAGDKVMLAPFLSSEIVRNTNPSVAAPFDFGSVREVFMIDTAVLLSAYRKELLKNGQLISEKFEYDKLVSDSVASIGSASTQEHLIQYKEYSARKIIFAEGAAAIHNPYFNMDSLIPKKGEYLIIKAPRLRLQSILKGAIFVIPLGNDLYKAGATFDHHSTSKAISHGGKAQLTEAVKKMINCPFEVVGQVAGMRPTVKDRRPLLGTVSAENILFFNGLGTRGLIMAPLLSKWLYEFSENNLPLPKEVNIKRFIK